MCLESISFSSYKRFAGSEIIELAPLTILVGKNSSGKSSVLKLLPMLETSFFVNIADEGQGMRNTFRKSLAWY